MRDGVIAIVQQYNFDSIYKFSQFLCNYSNDYFDLIKLDLSKDIQDNYQLIKRENIKIENNIFKVNVPYDLKLRKFDIENIFKNINKSNIRSPPFSYYKKGSKFIIQIEYCGKLEVLKIKKNVLNGQYKFSIIGKTAYSPIKCSQINRGEFLLNFSVGLDFITIKSNNYEEKNDLRCGILNIIYEICDLYNDENDDDCLEDDDNW